MIDQIGVRKPGKTTELQARREDLDLIRASPYRPAAREWSQLRGLTQDRTRSHVQRFKIFLATRLASTQGFS
ncbi:hypothetical protein, partial [Sinorhizobium sp. BJ1]|uniref:hypothetical protein n=1 Tax=Sinorhizobium sp. BJ1 TaxID=2035455 RepID=UPI001AECCAA0